MVKYTKLEDILGLKFKHHSNKAIVYTIVEKNTSDENRIKITWYDKQDFYIISKALQYLNEGIWIPINEQPKEIIINLW